MTGRKTPLTDRLAELSAAVPAANQNARALELEHRRVVAEIEQLTDATLDAYAANDEARAGNASKQRAALETGSLREAEERLEGAKRAVDRAEAERSLYAAAHFDGLIAERHPDARAAAQAVEDAVEQLGQAQTAWNAVERDVAALLRLAGHNTRDMPRFPERLAVLVRDARHAADVSVPPPVPRSHAMVPGPRPPLIPPSLPKPDPATHPSRTRGSA